MKTPTNVILCDDAAHGMRHNLATNSVDLIITSPPYDDVRDYEGFDIDLFAIGKQCYRVLKHGGMMAFVIQDGTSDYGKSMTTFRTTVDYVDRIGFKLFECVIYQRHGKPGAWWNTRFRVDHEYIMLFLKGDKPKFFDKEPLKIPAKHAGEVWTGTQRLTNGDMIPIKETVQKDLKCRGTIWPYNTSNTEDDDLKKQHPATFPDKMVEDLIVCFTQSGEIVLDPMIGSGTTAKVAKRLGRKYIGIDIAQEYCDLSEQGLALIP